MSLIGAMLSDPLFLHYVGFFVGLAAFGVLFFDLKTVLETDWHVFSSRFFLNADSTVRNMLNVTRLLSLAVTLMVLGHFFIILERSPYLINLVQAGATASITAAVILQYYMKSRLHQPENWKEK